MTDSGYCVKVPGKLMIAGEYAVLEPNQKAVVAAVNRYVTAYVKPCGQNKLSLPQLGLEEITWETNDERVQFNVSDSRLSFIQNSIYVVKQFLQEKSIVIRSFQLQIKSELDDPLTGKKYGLGSSAAVVVAVVSAVLSLHSGADELPALDQIFKLSAIAHLKTQKSGSGADIAAAVYGGWLEYSAYSAKWLLNELEQGKTITDVINGSWLNLSIKSLNAPSQLHIAAGWTREPVATAPMIKSVHNFSEKNQIIYNEFLRESAFSVSRLIRSFEENDCAEAINALAQNRKVLLMLAENAGITIETAELKTLCSIAEIFGSGKPSGAGGGDCGIAFLKGSTHIQELHDEWEAAGISPLNLCICKIGVFISEQRIGGFN